MSNLIFEIKLEINNDEERKNLIDELIRTLKKCRIEVDSLLKLNLGKKTNFNLIEIKSALGTNDFTDMKQDISADDLKSKLK